MVSRASSKQKSFAKKTTSGAVLARAAGKHSEGRVLNGQIIGTEVTRVETPEMVVKSKGNPESPLFQGNLGWLKYYSIWPDDCSTCPLCYFPSEIKRNL